MNRNAVSAECAHGMHSACTYESCACRCHALDDDPWEMPFDDDGAPDLEAA